MARPTSAPPRVAIGAEFDLHCHLSALMLDSADVLVGYKESPHTDPMERAAELFALIADTADGKIKPVMARYDCRMIAQYRTSVPPISGAVPLWDGCRVARYAATARARSSVAPSGIYPGDGSGCPPKPCGIMSRARPTNSVHCVASPKIARACFGKCAFDMATLQLWAILYTGCEWT